MYQLVKVFILLISEIMSSDSEIIKLNVGGELFITMKSTLIQSPWFVTLFSGKFKTEMINNNQYFIDRDPELFSDVLNYLRNGETIQIFKFEGDKIRFQSFVEECKYFGLTVTDKIEWTDDKNNQYLSQINKDQIIVWKNFLTISENQIILGKKLDKIIKYAEPEPKPNPRVSLYHGGGGGVGGPYRRMHF